MRKRFWSHLSRVCLANQVGGEEAAEKPFLEECLATREANEKMVLEPLAYSSDTP
ncbi:hypothetical protein CLV36_1187 [Laceyella sediminis]|uniref:Uncharacterized protein n=3 Tax=Thermoactinomycetaceae TaxID=186824 RepID=A0AA45WSA2_9BACL|nr:hypothetical protein CLV36_1187 [Laceyella sediminis]SMP34788.1 hypothetical protein SAMN06265361_1127 [Laceyella tengchongensis]